MLKRIKESCEKFENRNAFFINNRFYTYKEFALKLSEIREKIGVETTVNERFIGLITNDDIETYASIFAILFSGKGFIPINSDNPPRRINEIIEQCNIKTIINSMPKDNFASEIVEKNNINLCSVKNLPNCEINLELPIIDGKEIATIMFTSGSTGKPKGIPESRDNIDAFIEAFMSLGYDLNEEDKFLQMIEISFDLSYSTYLIPLCIGACIYHVSSDGIRFLNAYNLLEEHNLTAAMFVPSFISFLKPYLDEIELPFMRYSFFCGEAFYSGTANNWQKCVPNCKIINTYGPTEGTNICFEYLWNPLNENDKSYKDVISIGRPFKDMYAIVVDENNKIVECNIKGELCISGPQVTGSYWNDIENTQKAYFTIVEGNIEKKFYKTGDIVFCDKDGDYMFCGRTDQQVKVRGYRIELGEIEFYVRKFCVSSKVVVFTIADSENNNSIIVAIENFEGNISELEKYLKEKLLWYMFPSEILVLKEFPLNSNGKIDRKRLKNEYILTKG